MAKSYRIERVSETIKELLSELLLGDDIKDPRIGLVTVTAVRVSGDMTVAKVHFSVMGDEIAREETTKGLVSARNFMRKVIADELKLRVAPELRFVYDDSLDRALRIDQALKADSTEGSEGDDDREEN